MDRLREICESKPRTWRDEIEVIDSGDTIKPQNIIRDYWARNVVNLRMCGNNGFGQGMASTAVTHAVAEHDIKLSRVTRSKGDYLCGFKTTARRGFDSVTSLDPVNCPQCAKAVKALGLQPSIRIKEGFWD
jgi:hypothetical protein